MEAQDGVLAGLGADVGEVAQDAEPVHLGQHVAAEVGEAAVALLVAAGADEVLGVVGELHDAQAQLMEEGEMVEAVLDAARVLPAQDDAGLALPLGALDVVGGVDLGDEVGVVAQPGLPAREVAHGLGEVLPHAAGAVGGGDPAAAHVLEHAAAEIGDVEAVDDDQLVVELGHLARPSLG